MEKPVLRNCRACGKEISRHSPFCRNCGHPQGAPLLLWLMVLFLMVLVAFYLAMTVYCLCHVHELSSYSDPGPRHAEGLRQDTGLSAMQKCCRRHTLPQHC